MPKKQITTAPITLDHDDWVAKELSALCQELLSRPALRRGPYVFDEAQLHAVIAACAPKSKARRFTRGGGLAR